MFYQATASSQLTARSKRLRGRQRGNTPVAWLPTCQAVTNEHPSAFSVVAETEPSALYTSRGHLGSPLPLPCRRPASYATGRQYSTPRHAPPRSLRAHTGANAMTSQYCEGNAGGRAGLSTIKLLSLQLRGVLVGAWRCGAGRGWGCLLGPCSAARGHSPVPIPCSGRFRTTTYQRARVQQ